MKKGKIVLKLKVENNEGVRYYYLKNKDQLTIGKNPESEIPLIGQHYPKKHTLFKGKGNYYLLRIYNYMEGEISFKNSTLMFKDLITHQLLDKEDDVYLVRITPGKSGRLNIGDIKIEFSFDSLPPTTSEFPLYWRFHSNLRSLTQDLTFKLIFFFFLVINGIFLYSLNSLEIPKEKPIDFKRVPQRLARFIIKPPSVEKPLAVVGKTTGGAGPKKEAKKREPSSPKGRAKKAGKSRVAEVVARRGLLGLITGRGPSSKSSSMMDYLLDRGLFEELEDVVSSPAGLKKGRGGESSTAEELEDFLSLEDLGLGTLPPEEEEVERVQLRKEGKVDLEEEAQITASEEAAGYRTEESIKEVILSHLDWITYTYNKFLKTNPKLRGKIVIEITIAASGEITKCVIVSSTVNNPAFERAILDIVRRWRFNPIPKGVVTVNYPFVFFTKEI